MGLDQTADKVNFPLPDPATFPSTRFGEVGGTLTLTSTHGEFTAMFAGRDPEDNIPNKIYQSNNQTLVISLQYEGEYTYTVTYPAQLGLRHSTLQKTGEAAAYRGTAPPTGVTGPFQLSVRPCIGCVKADKPA